MVETYSLAERLRACHSGAGAKAYTARVLPPQIRRLDVNCRRSGVDG